MTPKILLFLGCFILGCGSAEPTVATGSATYEIVCSECDLNLSRCHERVRLRTDLCILNFTEQFVDLCRSDKTGIQECVEKYAESGDGIERTIPVDATWHGLRNRTFDIRWGKSSGFKVGCRDARQKAGGMCIANRNACLQACR